MAHFAVGYCLYELGRHHEAYRHLRYRPRGLAKPSVELVLVSDRLRNPSESSTRLSSRTNALSNSHANGGAETRAPELLAAMSA